MTIDLTQFKSVGDNVTFDETCNVVSPERVSIGSNVDFFQYG